NLRSQTAADEIGPLISEPRLQAAYELRLELADRMRAGGIPALHVCNDDEALYPNKIGSYSKGLPHNALGEVDLQAYGALRSALQSGVPSDFELIPLGGSRKLTNPQAGLAFETEGYDPHQFVQPPAPAFASAEAAAEMVELYWMALLRDVRFTDYGAHGGVQFASNELSSLIDFKGPKVDGRVTYQTLFRDNLPGALAGPYISQFLLKPAPFGAEYVERRIRTLQPASNKVTTFAHWLAVQNGNVPQENSFDSTRRYIRNGRDLSQWVHVDVLFQAYFDACLILATPPSSDPLSGGIGAPPNPGNPYLGSATQEGFATWGPPFFKTLLCEVSLRALKAVWFQKWFVHRRLRPETFGGRIHVHKTGGAEYPIHSQVLNSTALNYIGGNGTYLLHQAFPEGSPTHPAYGAGHATVAGACVTVLKALFDGSFVVPQPVVPDSTGTVLIATSTTTPLTVTGELNKLASNIATGRNHAGVHWRSDATESLKLGEAVAIQFLLDHKATLNEGGSFIFQKFDGTTITL
ncbi:MAG TPA: vanadium-dependent haloperoxidase, partial [Thermoanaerobaculia bacterium]